MFTVTRPSDGVAGLDGLGVEGLDELPHADAVSARPNSTAVLKRMSIPPEWRNSEQATYRRPRSAVSGSLFHADFEQRRRPAAAETAAAVAGVVVRGEVQDVVAGFAELHARRRAPVERRGARRQLLD